jgi:hypothetical protein
MGQAPKENWPGFDLEADPLYFDDLLILAVRVEDLDPLRDHPSLEEAKLRTGNPHLGLQETLRLVDGDSSEEGAAHEGDEKDGGPSQNEGTDGKSLEKSLHFGLVIP